MLILLLQVPLLASRILYRTKEMTRDTCRIAPHFTSFPVPCDTDANNNAGPSRRPPPTFSSFPEPASPELAARRSWGDRLDGRQRHRKHRDRHDGIESDERHRSKKPKRGSKHPKNSDDDDGERDSPVSVLSRSVADSDHRVTSTWDKRYGPYRLTDSDTVRTWPHSRLYTCSRNNFRPRSASLLILLAIGMPTARHQVRGGLEPSIGEKSVGSTVNPLAETLDGRLLGLSGRYRAVATGSKTEAGLEVAKAGQEYVSMI